MSTQSENWLAREGAGLAAVAGSLVMLHSYNDDGDEYVVFFTAGTDPGPWLLEKFHHQIIEIGPASLALSTEKTFSGRF
jgi:hypothetical protein